jgi:hypothetical protein
MFTQEDFHGGIVSDDPAFNSCLCVCVFVFVCAHTRACIMPEVGYGKWDIKPAFTKLIILRGKLYFYVSIYIFRQKLV